MLHLTSAVVLILLASTPVLAVTIRGATIIGGLIGSP